MEITKETKIIKGYTYEIGNKTFITRTVPEPYINDIDICVRTNKSPTKFSIASLDWDSKEQTYELKSVGLRLCVYGNKKLLKWIYKVAKKYTTKILEELGETDGL